VLDALDKSDDTSDVRVLFRLLDDAQDTAGLGFRVLTTKQTLSNIDDYTIGYNTPSTYSIDDFVNPYSWRHLLFTGPLFTELHHNWDTTNKRGDRGQGGHRKDNLLRQEDV
jgi:hypothetical protein